MPEVSYVNCRNCPISIILDSVNYFLLYRKFQVGCPHNSILKYELTNRI